VSQENSKPPATDGRPNAEELSQELKKPYTKPVLVVHGSVASLTYGHFGGHGGGS